MSARRIQLFLMVGVCAITLHFSIRFVIEATHYFSLNSQAEALVSQWEIVEIKNRYAIKSNFEFEAKGKNWRGEFTLLAPYYLNEFAALSALKEKAKEKWSAWYNSSNPQISALQKSFPVGLLLRSLICYGVIIYFFCLYKRLVRV